MAHTQPHSRRGRGRGPWIDGRGRGAFYRRTPHLNHEPALPAPESSQERLTVITLAALETNTTPTQAVQVKDVDYVASYNWLDNNRSTIIVPGQPPRWCPPAKNRELDEDYGQYYRDVNAAYHPPFPLEPAVRAVYELNPRFDASQIDLFGCGNTIGNLLSFARSDERTFRFGVERVGKTLLLVRKTNTPKELIQDVRGYGHSFPEAYTMWDLEVKGSSSHQRIIRYNFAGLQCMVRAESDGYLPNKTSMGELTRRDLHRKQHLDLEPPEHLGFSIGSSIETSKSRTDQISTSHSSPQKLSIKKAGRNIDRQAIFDLKTRSIRRKDTIQLSEFLPRLWVNQIPNLILAWHSCGLFDEIDVNNIVPDVQEWEQENQTTLVKLHEILKVLIGLSNQHARFEVRRTKLGDMEIWSEVPGWAALPSKLKTRWSGESTESDDEDETDGGLTIGLENSEEEADYLKF